MSNNIIQNRKQYTGSIEDIIKGYKGIYINQSSDYTTTYRITDAGSFDKFCSDFLYPFFELSLKKPEYLYSYPGQSP